MNLREIYDCVLSGGRESERETDREGEREWGKERKRERRHYYRVPEASLLRTDEQRSSVLS